MTTVFWGEGATHPDPLFPFDDLHPLDLKYFSVCEDPKEHFGWVNYRLYNFTGSPHPKLDSSFPVETSA